LSTWKILWTDAWENKWKIIQDQHKKATGKEINLTSAEVKKLKFTSLPNDVRSTLAEIDKVLFPNLTYLLCLLGVLPFTTCEAERSVSALRRLKMYTRSTMGEERLTGLALMNVHSDISLDINELIDVFASRHPRRMKLTNILDDDIEHH